MLIRITDARDSRAFPLSINGRSIQVPTDRDFDLPDDFLPALKDSNHTFEIVGGDADEAELSADDAGASGRSSAELAEPDEESEEAEQPAEVNDEAQAPESSASGEEQPVEDEISEERREELLKLLDGNVETVVAALPALTASELGLLYAAEEAGKTRKTVKAAIEEQAATFRAE